MKRFQKTGGMPILSLLAAVIFIMALPCVYDFSSGDAAAMESERHAASGGDEQSDFGSKAIKDGEEERSYRRDNVVITVKKLYAEDRYFWNFEVTAENLNDIKKTIEGKICLYNMYIQPRECGAEECVVDMAVPPKSVLTRKFRCRGKMDMNSWTFLILEVHNY